MTEIERKMFEKKLDEIVEHTNRAADSAKGSAAVAYTASNDAVVVYKRIEKKLDDYIQEDINWKTRAEPVIELGNNARGASQIVLYLTGGIIAIGGAYEVIKNLFNK